ncbi:hypothetical protein [Microbispora rosea]
MITIMAAGTGARPAFHDNGASHRKRAPLGGEAARAERTEVSP